MAEQVTFEVRGLTQLINKLDRLDTVTRGAAANRALTAGAYVIETKAKLAINTGAKSGKTYERGGKLHTASAPGQAPATDTGMLVNSIGVYSELGNMDTVIVGVAAEYAVYLEFGTSRMDARPFMRPAVVNNLDEISGAIKRELSRAVSEALA